MKRILFILYLGIISCISTSFISGQDNNSKDYPKVFLLDKNILEANKQRILSKDKSLMPSFKKLYKEAEKALNLGPFSVTFKDKLPPSGDKHDYMSLATYWWPDLSKSDSLPYIRKDGEVNPEVYKFTDKKNFTDMASCLHYLSLAYYITGEEKFAGHAVNLLKVWFIDPDTKMNPNFKFAQAIPGRTTGRGTGLIEARHFSEIIDAIGLIESSPSWKPEIESQIKDWFEKYYFWLTESKEGRHEESAKNNHGTWYDVQAVSIALFLNKNDAAKKICETAKTKRIESEIEPDGKQPFELVRTKSLGYSTFNLEALFSLAKLAQNVGVDLWRYESTDSSSISKALDYLIPFYLKEKEWQYKQIAEFEYSRAYPIFLAAEDYIDYDKYKKYADDFRAANQRDVINIVLNKF